MSNSSLILTRKYVSSFGKIDRFQSTNDFNNLWNIGIIDDFET